MIAALSDLLYSIRLLRADCALVEIGVGSAMRLRMRQAVHLHVVLSGQAVFRFAARDHVATLRPGQYLFAPPGTDHIIGEGRNPTTSSHFEEVHGTDTPPRLRIGAHADVQARLLSCALYVDTARHEALFRLLPELRNYRARNGPSLFDVPPLLNMAGISAIANGPGASAIYLKLAEMLLTEATRVSLTRDLNPALGGGVPDVPQIGTALRVIYQDPGRHWSIATLAREVGMSRSAFAAAFVRLVKETPMRFLTNVRMARAKNLLKEGAKSLPEIGHLTGYESEAAFARAFKRELGVSPGNYRRAVHGEAEREA